VRARFEHGIGLDDLRPFDAHCSRPHREDEVIFWRQKASPGRWVFVEGKAAGCRDCGKVLEHSWNYFVGSTSKLSLCTLCVAPHIGTA
jgi:hypothetical protein